MISYPISAKALCRRIAIALPATRNRDGTRRRGGRESWFRRADNARHQWIPGGDRDPETVWTELKPVFARIQGDGIRIKCVYCERQLGLGKKNLPDGDIDHFRPKSLYPRLAYDPRNYVLACRPCNETYKGSQFPIGKERAGDTTDPVCLAAESPELVHPLDPAEPKLEQIIGFDGILIKSIAPTGSREEIRANAMIDTLQLNRRDDLRHERAKTIVVIYLAKMASAQNDVAVNVLERAADSFNPHFNCAQSYLKLWQTDPARAEEIGEEADRLLRSLS